MKSPICEITIEHQWPPEYLDFKLRGGDELEAEGGGLFLQGLQASGLGHGGDFEGFGFVVGLLVFDHAVEDARQLVRGGDDAFGFAQARFEPTAELADLVAAARGRPGWALCAPWL